MNNREFNRLQNLINEWNSRIATLGDKILEWEAEKRTLLMVRDHLITELGIIEKEAVAEESK